jgi:ADP-ribose diphosphatase
MTGRGDGETGRWGDGGTGRRGDGETGRWADGERWGDGETGTRRLGEGADAGTRGRGEGNLESGTVIKDGKMGKQRLDAGLEADSLRPDVPASALPPVSPSPLLPVPPSPPPPVFPSVAVASWQRLGSEQVADCRVFRVRCDHSLDPRDGREHDFFVIEAPDWINVVPITADGRVVMIEQFRHGTNEVTLEVPGGMVDEGESAIEAANRELLEETGFKAREFVSLGKTRPNPAIQNNWLHSFVAQDCIFQEAPKFDGEEHIAVRLVPLADVPALIADGTINHALVVVAFHRLALFERRLPGESVI